MLAAKKLKATINTRPSPMFAVSVKLPTTTAEYYQFVFLHHFSRFVVVIEITKTTKESITR